MSNLDSLRSTYKPYRYTLCNSATILESSSGKFVVKKTKKDLFTLFNYLENRGFYDFPKIESVHRGNETVFEFIDDYSPYQEQKLLDLESSMASLHNKTVYFKKTALDSYKEIRENIISNILYLENYYESLFKNIIKIEYMAPEEYLFARNYYKIKAALNFCQSEIDQWYDMSKDNGKERVSVIHNNLSLDHFLTNNNRKAFISWDNYKIDIPILDFVHLYQKEYLNFDFSLVLEKYLKHFELLENEKKLLFVLLSIPPYFELHEKSHMDNCEIIREKIDYIYLTEKLIRPYYAVEKEE